jgi:hypothetical protein
MTCAFLVSGRRKVVNRHILTHHSWVTKKWKKFQKVVILLIILELLKTGINFERSKIACGVCFLEIPREWRVFLRNSQEKFRKVVNRHVLTRHFWVIKKLEIIYFLEILDPQIISHDTKHDSRQVRKSSFLTKIVLQPSGHEKVTVNFWDFKTLGRFPKEWLHPKF